MRLALWLMSRFGVHPSLIGDFREEWTLGRSPSWLLRQTTVAIVQTLRADFWEHKLLTLRAVLIGWSIGTGGATILRIAVMELQPRSFAPALLASAVWAAMVAATVARSHREQPMGAALLFMATFALRGAFGVWNQWQTQPEYLPMAGTLQFQGMLLASMFAGALLASRRASATRVLG